MGVLLGCVCLADKPILSGTQAPRASSTRPGSLRGISQAIGSSSACNLSLYDKGGREEKEGRIAKVACPGLALCVPAKLEPDCQPGIRDFQPSQLIGLGCSEG